MEAAEALNVSPKTIYWRIAKGLSSDEQLKSKRKPFEWNGKQYSSLNEAANQLGVTRDTIRLRNNKGQKSDKDLGRK